MEFNEDLLSTITRRSIIMIAIGLTLLCHPEDKVFGAMSVFEDKPIDLPLAACKDAIDPLHQK